MEAGAASLLGGSIKQVSLRGPSPDGTHAMLSSPPPEEPTGSPVGLIPLTDFQHPSGMKEQCTSIPQHLLCFLFLFEDIIFVHSNNMRASPSGSIIASEVYPWQDYCYLETYNATRKETIFKCKFSCCEDPKQNEHKHAAFLYVNINSV